MATPHLGHARPAITFDLVFRYLKQLGYKVRYVRNITDVGHLEHDADEGEDKIVKKARLEQLEPMEIAQYHTNRYHAAMDALNWRDVFDTRHFENYTEGPTFWRHQKNWRDPRINLQLTWNFGNMTQKKRSDRGDDSQGGGGDDQQGSFDNFGD